MNSPMYECPECGHEVEPEFFLQPGCEVGEWECRDLTCEVCWRVITAADWRATADNRVINLLLDRIADAEYDRPDYGITVGSTST